MSMWPTTSWQQICRSSYPLQSYKPRSIRYRDDWQISPALGMSAFIEPSDLSLIISKRYRFVRLKQPVCCCSQGSRPSHESRFVQSPGTGSGRPIAWQLPALAKDSWMCIQCKLQHTRSCLTSVTHACIGESRCHLFAAIASAWVLTCIVTNVKYVICPEHFGYVRRERSDMIRWLLHSQHGGYMDVCCRVWHVMQRHWWLKDQFLH